MFHALGAVEVRRSSERFLRTAGPGVRTELDAFLADRPTRPDADWLIDMLGFNALYLQGKLAPAHHTAHADHTERQAEVR